MELDNSLIAKKSTQLPVKVEKVKSVGLQMRFGTELVPTINNFQADVVKQCCLKKVLNLHCVCVFCRNAR